MGRHAGNAAPVPAMAQKIRATVNGSFASVTVVSLPAESVRTAWLICRLRNP